MKKIISVLTIAASLCYSSFAMAQGQPEFLENVYVTKIHSRPGQNYAGSVVSFSKLFVNNTCSDGGNWGRLSNNDSTSEGRQLTWSMLMIAYTQQIPLNVWSTGECGYHNTISEIQFGYH